MRSDKPRAPARLCGRPGCDDEGGGRHPFYVHVSQVDPKRTEGGNAKVHGDCASCHRMGKRCAGYDGPPPRPEAAP